jgi:biopolymer transport protein ExbB
MIPILAAFSLKGAFHFFHQGGFFMVPLLLCSFVAVVVIVLRGLALRRDIVIPPIIEHEVEGIQPGDEDAANRLAKLVRHDRSAVGRVIHVGLHHLNWPKSENMEAVQTRARQEIVRLESGIFILEIIVGIAPLLGLLGAVSGLISVFAAFGSDAAAQDPHGIAKGISEALSTTIVGLGIAIPSLIAYSYFTKKVESMAADMESLVADLLAKCYYHQAQHFHAAHPAAPMESYAPPASPVPPPVAPPSIAPPSPAAPPPMDISPLEEPYA